MSDCVSFSEDRNKQKLEFLSPVPTFPCQRVEKESPKKNIHVRLKRPANMNAGDSRIQCWKQDKIR